MNTLSALARILVVCIILLTHNNVYAENKVDINQKMLVAAKYEGYKQIIELNNLLNEGADITATNEDGLSAIHLAAKYNTDPKVIEILIDYGANINQVALNQNLERDNPITGTPLFYALCYNPNFKVVETILKLQKELDINSIYSLVTLAARNPNIEIIDKMYELLVNDMLLESAVNTNRGVIDKFLKLGGNINTSYPGKVTSPLYVAVKANNLSGVEFLLETGVNLTTKYENNQTILLVAAGNNVNRNTGKIIYNLLVWGSYINELDNDGNSALHLAVKRATSLYRESYQAYPLNVIEQLIDLGADISLKNFAGETPLEYAKQHLMSNSDKKNLSSEVIQILKQTKKTREEELIAAG